MWHCVVVSCVPWGSLGVDLGPAKTPEPAAGSLSIYLASSSMGLFLLAETAASRGHTLSFIMLPLGQCMGTWLTGGLLAASAHYGMAVIQCVIRAYTGDTRGTPPPDVPK